jgi:hypothetical protein
MSDAPTPETDAEVESLMKWPDYFVTADLARRLERERNDLLRNPDISECDKGHRFRTIASHPTKSEREWECPHCAVKERDTLKAAALEMIAARDAFNAPNQNAEELWGGSTRLIEAMEKLREAANG